MSDLEEQAVTALKTFYEKIHPLQQINIRDMLKPEMYSQYEHTLQAAYDALTTVEDALNALGMKLEYKHWRLGGAVDELKLLMVQTRSSSDTIMEEFEQRFS